MHVETTDAVREEVRRDHERLKTEHAALVEIFHHDANLPSNRAARQAYLDQLRQHVVRLHLHRAVLEAIR